MAAKDPLFVKIAAHLEAESNDDLAEIERTLTDGYARALALEAERWRLQRRIVQITAAAAGGDEDSRRELVAATRLLEGQDRDIGELRSELTRLQRRHSSAVRALAG